MAVGDKQTCLNCGRTYFETAWPHKCPVVETGTTVNVSNAEAVTEDISTDVVILPHPQPRVDTGYVNPQDGVDTNREYKTEWARQKRAKDKLIASVSPQFKGRVAVLADQDVRLML